MSSADNSTIDLRDSIKYLWAFKKIILYITFFAAFLSVIVSLSIENNYKSSALLMPKDNPSNIQLQQGGLGGSPFAGLLNIGLNQDNPTVLLAKKTLTSKTFILNFIKKYNLQPLLIAGEKWDAKNNKIVFSSGYDSNTGKLNFAPLNEDLYKSFLDRFSVSTDRESGYITIEFISLSPFVSQDILNKIIYEINDVIRIKEQKNAESSIEFLKKSVGETQSVDLRLLFNKIIESKTRVIMLAEIDEFFILDVIDPPNLAERKHSPRRSLICILGTLIGFSLSIFAVILLNFFEFNKFQLAGLKNKLQEIKIFRRKK